ncbi:MAG: flagellar basal body rod protein FlgC [Zetaproteobacteria bacterium]|nr:flagellar basal body rod protein FlgC [Zetaproteobacteria bacterium]
MSDPFFSSMTLATSGMRAQKQRMDVVSENIANASTTKAENGQPYRRKMVVFGTEKLEKNFAEVFKSAGSSNADQLQSVVVRGVIKDKSEYRMVYEPSHPDADKNGMVAYPNVNPTTEMMDFMAASRSFEANTSVFEGSKRMFQKTMALMK